MIIAFYIPEELADEYRKERDFLIEGVCPECWDEQEVW